jgi:hypothetical protein
MTAMTRIARSRYGAFTAMGLWLVAIATGCAQTRQPHLTESHMPASSSTVSRTHAHDAELIANFDYDLTTRVVNVRYQVKNNSPKSSLAIFDRADLHAVKQGQQALGDVAVPHQTAEGNDITLWHTVLPMDPIAESEPTPTAIRLAPGDTLSGQFTFGLWGDVVPTRLRWCLGIMPFDERLFGSPAAVEAGELWYASTAVVELQRTLCTRWYDIASAAFADTDTP